MTDTRRVYSGNSDAVEFDSVMASPIESATNHLTAAIQDLTKAADQAVAAGRHVEAFKIRYCYAKLTEAYSAVNGLRAAVDVQGRGDWFEKYL